MLKDQNQRHYVLKIYDGSTLIILRQSVNTKIVENYTSISLKNQKYVINGKIIKIKDDQLISSLQISHNELLMVFTRQKNSSKNDGSNKEDMKIIKKLQKQPNKQNQVQYIQDSSISEVTQNFKMKDLEQYLHKANTQNIWMIPAASSEIQEFGFFLWKQGIPKVTSVLFNEELQNSLIQSFIKLNIFKKSRKDFLGNTQFLKFVCRKIAQSNPNLRQLPNCIKKIQIQLYQLQPILNQSQKQQVMTIIQNSVDLQLVKELQKLGYEQKIAKDIIQLSQNNLLKAIEYLTFNKKLFQIQVKIPLQKLDQCKFLYSWFMKPQHIILRLKFASSVRYLDAYTLSMRQKSLQFYNLLINERKYVLKLIKENKPDLYTKSQ